MQGLLQRLSNADPARLRRDLRFGETPDLRLRRATIAASLIGIAGMGIVTLFQSGIIKHLKDPPLRDFDSDKVNSSDTAYSWGMPDAPLSIVSHSVNLALATAGGADRSDTRPWIPWAATAAALMPAATSAKYLFYQMPVREKGWCPYCIVDALTHIATFGFTLWETSKALRSNAKRLMAMRDAGRRSGRVPH
jgi:uncharacterized membrane protein